MANGKRLTDYLASLTVTQGRLAGAPFPVLPWERRFTGLADPVNHHNVTTGWSTMRRDVDRQAAGPRREL